MRLSCEWRTERGNDTAVLLILYYRMTAKAMLAAVTVTVASPPVLGGEYVDR